MSGRNSGRALIGMVIAASMVLSACGGGGDGEKADDAPTPTSRVGTSETTTARDAGDVKLAATPPLVGYTGTLGIASFTGGISLPVGYFENAAEDPSLLEEEGTTRQGTSVSPDGTTIAIAVDETPTDAAKFRFVSVETGDEIETVDFEGRGAERWTWTGDSRAIFWRSGANVYLHRIGGATTTISDDPPGELEAFSPLSEEVAFASDADTTEVIACTADGIRHYSAGEQASDVRTTPASEECATAQLEDDDGDLVALLKSGAALYRAVPGSEPVEIALPSDIGPWFQIGASHIYTKRCGPTAVINASDERYGATVQSYVYDVETDAVVATSGVVVVCPVVSPDGQAVAVATQQSVAVAVSLESSKVTEIARTGIPVAWSDDSEKVLIDADETSIVAADGSGGKQASVQIERGAPKSHCRVGDTGRALLTTQSGLVLFDVGEDTAVPVGGDRSLHGFCTLSADERWVLAGDTLIDLSTDRFALLFGRFGTPSVPLGAYRWVGEQIRVPAWGSVTRLSY